MNMTHLGRKNRNMPKYVLFFACICAAMLCGRRADAAAIDDGAALISDKDEEKLQDACDAVLSKYGAQVYIWTSPDVGAGEDCGFLMEEYVRAREDADSDNPNAIILMVGTGASGRIYEIQAYGDAREMINDRRRGRILDSMQKDMSNGDYYGAMRTFCGKVGRYMNASPKFDSPIFSPLAQLAACIVAAVIIIFSAAKNYAGRAPGGGEYFDSSDSKIIGSFERYTHTTVSRVKKADSQMGGGDGESYGGYESGGRRF